MRDGRNWGRLRRTGAQAVTVESCVSALASSAALRAGGPRKLRRVVGVPSRVRPGLIVVARL
eukprot:8838175-Pyramimonas_sp.AAC.1